MELDNINQYNNFFSNFSNKRKRTNNLFSKNDDLFSTNNIENKICNLEKRVTIIENYLKKDNKMTHFGITCSNCNAYNIKGIRYKCGHCLNYNVCEECEKKLDKIHDNDHLFVRIHNPNLAYLVGN